MLYADSRATNADSQAAANSYPEACAAYAYAYAEASSAYTDTTADVQHRRRAKQSVALYLQ